MIDDYVDIQVSFQSIGRVTYYITLKNIMRKVTPDCWNETLSPRNDGYSTYNT